MSAETRADIQPVYAVHAVYHGVQVGRGGVQPGVAVRELPVFDAGDAIRQPSPDVLDEIGAGALIVCIRVGFFLAVAVADERQIVGFGRK